ncbi:MAG TPA: hypothetical protein VFT91_09830 [Dehalococcoidia bacterium]|nr:hypothetical protein [Dehalococcoidia bacterium]
MLVVFVGILLEQMAVQRRLDVLEHLQLDGFPLALGSYGRKPVLVCRTGLGRERGQRAAEAVFSAYNPSAVLSLRLAGSLPEQARLGALVLCQKTYLCRKGEPPAVPSAEADRRLLALAQQAAQSAGLGYTLGDALTAASPTAAPLVQQLLRSKQPVAVADTEGYWLLEAASLRGIPFLSVRGALGRSFDRAPEVLGMTAERGVLNPRRVAAHLLRRPTKLAGLLQLTFGVRVAARTISRFMKEFLREWSMEP